MKYLSKYKILEAGEWSRGIDWDYAKENPNDSSEEVQWILYLEKEIKKIKKDLTDKSILKIINIRGFDMYQGPYALVKIFDKVYEIWTTGNYLYISDFDISNSSENENPGFEGSPVAISELLNDIIELGGIDIYKNIKKYNL